MIEEKSESKSDFVAYLSVKNHEKINHELILPKIKEFFKVRNISDYKSIVEQACISDLDFKNTNFSDFFPHFYDYIIDKIYKDKEKNIETVVTYCITLDKTNCSKTCDKTGINYDDFFLYQKPVFYFIHIDIQDIFAFLKAEPA
ncbi:hypothetical protein [Candidatus Methylobacter oryzae]|uniref:Uncharacterized protein n=1 Tax=Candidatus Methylobacter oryzae TaxID=2497749 RepID=A0ABY3C4Z6_9GAMM|nr:hypothetical protein [Candidatus Methylobacter oryzae]TRW89537.1 hypothetical protein EKO24_020965 [Candidatus Methylobacter oryzae]